MTSKHHVLRFTDLEARCLIDAAGQTMDSGDALEATFSTTKERQAACRAYKKLIMAVFEKDALWEKETDMWIDLLGTPSKKEDQ